jgi:hypothetical protein
MEENLSSKMAEFMTALDQVKKYRTIVASMTDFTLIVLGSMVAALTLNISMQVVFLYFGHQDYLSVFASFLFVALIPIGITIGVIRIRRKIKSVKVGEWKNTLSEGAPGAIKLLQELQWDNIFGGIRSAKLGFFLYGLFKVLAYWALAMIFFVVLNNVVIFVFHMSANLITIVLFSLVVVLILSKNDLRNRYEQMGRLDWLMWELRWFESEFRGANFET